MCFAPEFDHVRVWDVRDCVAPVYAGTGGVVHEVLCAAHFVCMATRPVDCLGAEIFLLNIDIFSKT